MGLEFSLRIALLRVVSPIVETIRRWHQLGDLKIWPFWLYDFLLGVFLLYGAWLTKKDVNNGKNFLSAACGFACGMAYFSFFDQITSLDKADHAPIPSVWVAVIKGIFFLITILGLIEKPPLHCLSDSDGSCHESKKIRYKLHRLEKTVITY